MHRNPDYQPELARLFETDFRPSPEHLPDEWIPRYELLVHLAEYSDETLMLARTAAREGYIDGRTQLQALFRMHRLVDACTQVRAETDGLWVASSRLRSFLIMGATTVLDVTFPCTPAERELLRDHGAEALVDEELRDTAAVRELLARTLTWFAGPEPEPGHLVFADTTGSSCYYFAMAQAMFSDLADFELHNHSPEVMPDYGGLDYEWIWYDRPAPPPADDAGEPPDGP